ncbi:MAG TPA: 16S rRNA (guanine(527)-N(7))-methyltransferase RsmG [Candidatus Limnocylindrales bacterium]|nr:16S rRNA (guanine(527)-N(7))-methyltransferase RsmG [Candidatus Limnocylindrales bacterium]
MTGQSYDIGDLAIEAALRPYGIAADAQLCQSIREYIALLLRWNRQVSLTTVTDPIEILRFHFGESLFATNAVPIRNGRLADFGSGAGFPGIPLALVKPALEVVLIESNAKKSAFLSEVKRLLDLRNLEIFCGRGEGLPEEKGPFDVVAARAIGRFDGLLDWSSTHLGAGGSVVLWLGEADAEIIRLNQPEWTWRAPIKIPASARRVLLVGQKSKS